jgi:hypothetical protein
MASGHSSMREEGQVSDLPFEFGLTRKLFLVCHIICIFSLESDSRIP